MTRFRRFCYRRFLRMAAVRLRVSRRLTPAGVLVAGAVGAAAVVGFDTGRSLGYQVFAFLAVLLGVAELWIVGFRPRLEVRRILPRHATVGEPFTYRVVVTNPGSREERGLTLFEDLADPWPSLQEFLRAREPGEERRNWFDRAVGYPRWTWLVARSRRATIPAAPVPPVPPRGAVAAEVAVTPLRRGALRFAGLTLARPDPFGLVRALASRPRPDRLLVLPRRYPVAALALPGSRKYQPGGVTLATSVGDSDEFASLRDYRPGDSVRRIHWRSWARVGHPVVREHQDEFFVRHALVLDTFTAGGDDDVFEAAVSVAASLAWALETREFLLDLLFVGADAYCVTAGRGLGQVDRLLEVLAGVEPCRDRTFRTLHRAVLARLGQLSGVICVLLGWDDDRRALVHALRAVGTPTRVFVVQDGPPVDGSPDPLEAAGELTRLVPGRIAEGLAGS